MKEADKQLDKTDRHSTSSKKITKRICITKQGFEEYQSNSEYSAGTEETMKIRK